MANESLQTETAVSDWLTENEVLPWLKVSRKTLYNWVRSGKIPCVKINHTKRYHKPSVEQALLRLQRNTPPSTEG